MTYSTLTNQVRETNQRSSRNGTEIDTFLIHHQAGTNDDSVIDSMVTGRKVVSANYTISNEGRLTLVVSERDRAWTSGSSKDGGRGASWDRRAVTVEIENELGAPTWRISNAALAMAAALLVDLRARYTIKHVIGHRDLWTLYQASYPTFCPGTETVDQIKSLAGTPSSLPAISPIKIQPILTTPAPGWTWVLPSAWVQKQIQGELRERNRYDGRVDGDWGRLSIAAIQLTLRNVGYTGLLDGIPGKMTCHFVQVYAQRFGDYNGPIDDDLGPNSWAGFLLGLQRP